MMRAHLAASSGEFQLELPHGVHSRGTDTVDGHYIAIRHISCVFISPSIMRLSVDYLGGILQVISDVLLLTDHREKGRDSQ